MIKQKKETIKLRCPIQSFDDCFQESCAAWIKEHVGLVDGNWQNIPAHCAIIHHASWKGQTK